MFCCFGRKKKPAMIKISVKYATCLSPRIYSAHIFSVFGNMIIHWGARLAIYWKTDDWHLTSNMDNSYTHWAACTKADKRSANGADVYIVTAGDKRLQCSEVNFWTGIHSN